MTVTEGDFPSSAPTVAMDVSADHSSSSREEEVAMFLSSLNTTNKCNNLPPIETMVSPGIEMEQSASFFERVSQLPVVNTTIKTIGNVYETGKNSSNILKV